MNQTIKQVSRRYMIAEYHSVLLWELLVQIIVKQKSLTWSLKF